ncbi:MAG TPA: glycosyltransferase family 9 protein [Verrucomicrobiae bacterium]
MKILIFRIGQLGDTVVSLPAMWAVRQQFPEAKMSLLSDKHPAQKYAQGADLLAGAGLFNEFLEYPVGRGAGASLSRPAQMIGLLATLRKKAFDALVYLAPSLRTPSQVERDRRFFLAGGIKKFIGMHGFPQFTEKKAGEPLPTLTGEAELLLARLAKDGVAVHPHKSPCYDLNLGQTEASEISKWMQELPSDDDRPWIGIGPGTKMPAKRWKTDRFAQAGSALIARHGVWPVVFGGAEDRAAGETLLRQWGCGYNAAGQLGLRASAAALKKCDLYLGNDTGTMHLAAAVGVKCAAIFSSRDYPGRWYPAGRGHKIFRTQIECEGCRLTECLERKNECIERITVEDVVAGCDVVLSEKFQRKSVLENRN